MILVVTLLVDYLKFQTHSHIVSTGFVIFYLWSFSPYDQP